MKKYKFFIAYLFFGILTTGINWVSYFLCYHVFHISNVLSTIIAWVLAVAFAFITNKLWVFSSKSFAATTLLREISTFVAARLATGVLDVIIMYCAVDLLHQNAGIWKLLSNVVVTILNYVLSKLIIFKSNPSK